MLERITLKLARIGIHTCGLQKAIECANTVKGFMLVAINLMAYTPHVLLVQFRNYAAL